MNVKQWIISTNNFMCYIAIGVVVLAGILAMLGGQVGGGIIFILTMWPLCAFICGFWIVLSKISDNTTRQVKLMETMIAKLEALEK